MTRKEEFDVFDIAQRLTCVNGKVMNVGISVLLEYRMTESLPCEFHSKSRFQLEKFL